MPVLKHVHTYVRAKKHDLSPDPLRFRCDHPDCSHTALRADLTGKRSICAKCKVEEFILDADSLKLSRPVCPKCSGTNKAKKMRELASNLDQLFSE